MKKIKECFRHGSIIEIRYEGGDERSFPTQTLAGGIAWPVTGPYYCCVLGKASAPNKDGIYEVRLILEIEENLPRNFHQSIADSSIKLLCRQFFANINDTTWDDYIALLDSLDSHDLGDRVDIYRPAITNWGAGIRYVQGLYVEGKLSIDRSSVLARQLGRLSKEDLLGTNCHEFYAIQGLVNTIKFFFERPAYNPPVVPSNYRYNF